MKKKIGIVILVVLVILIIGSRIYHFMVLNEVYQAIENFENENNRYYSVIIQNTSTLEQEIILKDNIVKWNQKKENIDEYCQWKCFDEDQEYTISLKDKIFWEKEFLISHSKNLINLPDLILLVYQDNQFNIKEFLKVKYILPVDYHNQKCYKIATNTQTLIISRDTYLPIYYSIDMMNSEKNEKVLTEITYEFKVGEVTDEDIALPDLTGYTKIIEP